MTSWAEEQELIDAHRKSVQKARRDLQGAKTKYDDALRMAMRDGVTNVALARWTGLTEGAIRMRAKRGGWNGTGSDSDQEG